MSRTIVWVMAGPHSAHAKPAAAPARPNRPSSPVPRRGLLAFLLAVLLVLVAAVRRTAASLGRALAIKDARADVEANAKIQVLLYGLIGTVLAVIIGFIGANIVMSTTAAQLPTYFENGREIINATSEASLDNGGAADSLLHGMSPILALSIVLGPLGLLLGIGAFFVIAKRKGGASFT